MLERIIVLFNSHEFLFLFLPIALLGFYILSLSNKQSKYLPISWLAVISLGFYAWWDIRYLLLLTASICFNYLIGRKLSNPKYNPARIKCILVFGIVINLAGLAYYKYFNFFIKNINSLFGLTIPLGDIILPLGISFFTFTQIAFLIDVYRKNATEYKFLSYVLFVTFFPHLIAGPILHHKEMMPQFEDASTFLVNWQNITVGTVVFVIGLFKKVIIADNLAVFAITVFNVASQGSFQAYLRHGLVRWPIVCNFTLIFLAIQIWQ